jgi:hypothetical protein
LKLRKGLLNRLTTLGANVLRLRRRVGNDDLVADHGPFHAKSDPGRACSIKEGGQAKDGRADAGLDGKLGVARFQQ